MGHEAVKPTFANSAEETVTLYWVDADGMEQPMGPLTAGLATSMTSFAGHVWRVRSEATGELLWEQALEASPAKQNFEIAACGGAAAATAGLSPEEAAEEQAWLEAHGRRDGPELSGCPVSVLLSEIKVRGFHVVCAVRGPTSADGDTLERLCIFADGLDAEFCSHSVKITGNATLRETVHSVLARVQPRRRTRPRAPEPALFSASGRRLPLDRVLEDVGMPSYRQVLVLVEGGAWHWPPVKVGFERPLYSFIHGGSGEIKMRTLSLKPRIFEVKSFIEERECDRMLEKAGPHVQKSGVVLKDADHGKAVDDWRTSENYFLPSTGDSILEALDERVQNLTRIPIVNSEYAQILKYSYRGRYTAHTDYFDPKDYKKDKRTMEMTANGVHNRLLTVFMYMSDVEKGGETYFPSHGGRPAPHDYEDCSIGLSVRPERQKVIIFYNMHPNGDLDPDSLHGGCRVLNGTKWSANFWVWNVKQNYKSSSTASSMAAALEKWEEHRDRLEEEVVSELAAGRLSGYTPTGEAGHKEL